MTKTITQTNEITGEKGKITHTISYNLDLDERPYGCTVKVVEETGKYSQCIESFDIPQSDLEKILQQSDPQPKVDTVINQALFHYLSQELQKRVGQWGHFWNIPTLQPQLSYYATRIGIENEKVDLLVQKVIKDGFEPGLALFMKRKQESREYLKREERKLSRSAGIYSPELKRLKEIAQYAHHIPGGEEKVVIIKKEVEEDIRQEAVRYFESDLEHAIVLLSKEKDPDATNPFQVVDTFASYIYDLQLFADYVPRGWKRLAELHQTNLTRTIALAQDALIHNDKDKEKTAQYIGESRLFLYWFDNSYNDRQPEFPIAAMRASIQQLEQKTEQKYRRPWYDLLED